MNTTDSETLSTLHEVHLINLDRSADRLNRFRHNNNHLNNVLRIPAVDGAFVNRQELIDQGTIVKDLPYGLGALGCALSHVGLWRKSDSQNRIVTIFEDDVICSRNFTEESSKLASSLPEDWDIIQWGYVFDPCFLWLDFGFAKAKLEFYGHRVVGEGKEFQSDKFPPVAVRLAHSFGLQAYSVSPKGARALLECCLPLRRRLIRFPGTNVRLDDVGIDCAMCAAYGSMQAYLCIPPLVFHDQTQASDRKEIGA